MNLFYSTRNILDFSGIIVNAANSDLRHGSGVCGAIHGAAGPELDDECNNIRYKIRRKKIPTGSAVMTGAYKCNASYIIHAVGPIYSNYTHNEACRLLSKTYMNAMRFVGNCDVAFPAISCGVYGFHIPIACKIAVTTLNYWLYNNPNFNSSIVLTAFTQEVQLEYMKLRVEELV